MSKKDGTDRKWVRALARLGRHPGVVIVTALGLFATGAVELAEEMIPDFEHFIGVHHGVMLMGFAGFVRGMTELLEGLGEVSELDRGE
jgi:hypothetical protein